MSLQFVKAVKHCIGEGRVTADQGWARVQGQHVRDLVIRFFVYGTLTYRSPELILQNKDAQMLSDMLGKAWLGKEVAAKNAAEIAQCMARWQPAYVLTKACRPDPKNFTITYDRSGYVRAVKHWRSGLHGACPRIFQRPQSLIAHSHQQVTCNGRNRSVSCSALERDN